jgi:photosystem II stability/assembly factor-like uncharacterized protein
MCVIRYLVISFFLIISSSLSKNILKENGDTLISSKNLNGIELRGIGPAFMSGRIADIAIHPENDNIWYIAVGSGGVWKTYNAGTTWEPIFDEQSSYSIGCIAIDPNNHNIIWVGTGENVGGRHVGYGDGIYKSEDGGKNWKNMGLKESEHISKIIINPNDSQIIYVASQGPLWSKGGERGFFKSSDSGKSWKRTLGDDEWIGVTDIVTDPRNSNLIYAATWQRHRNVSAYMGGGPGSGLYRSDDGGESWKKLDKGIPTSNLGKIGLAISPQNPDIVYAAIELDRRTGGVFRSDNRGSTWVKMSEAVSGATGPHYYQELYASPHVFDKLYLVDVRMQVSEDGGKTFRRMKESHKHSDNHAIAFRKDDPNYMLVGTDGGLYETFDNTENWRFINNLPITQFYKVAVDDSEPFYNIYGGTQDNSTQGGPSRTDNVHGIRNSDWFLTLGGDGHQPATEPGNPNIVYSEWQEGNLNRIDMTTGEITYIQPQPEEGDPFERFNWDAPILISPHSPKRLYFASQRLWRSDDRGDSWEPISDDLTRDQERIELQIMDRTWSWDSPWDLYAMSNYNTITSISESPLKEGLIYIGTDDGIIQVTENGGEKWKRIEVGSLPGVPKTSFVNDIKADLFDVNTVYVVLDNHKFGDLSPYILKSTDRGTTWQSISSNIPERNILWRLAQDHKKKSLLFLGTEFGLYFTLNGGKEWIKLNGGIPTISFRDIVIQKREDDLIGATFGRGFYILDDYSFLRDLEPSILHNKEAVLFTGRDALLYVPRAGHGFSTKGSQGASYFTVENPAYGALFTYYLADEYKTIVKNRQEKEVSLIKANRNVEFPGWDMIEKERRQKAPLVWLVIKDIEGNVIRKIACENKKGFNRVSWNLSYPDLSVIDSDKELPKKERSGPLASEGRYEALLYKEIDGTLTLLDGPKPFNVRKLYDGALQGSSGIERLKYNRKVSSLQREITAGSLILEKAKRKIEALRLAASKIDAVGKEIVLKIHDIRENLLNLDEQMNGNRSRSEVGEKNNPTIMYRLNHASRGISSNTYGPTKTQLISYELASKSYNAFKVSLDIITEKEIPSIEKILLDAGAPRVE